MAAINNLKLALLAHDHNAKTAKIKVSYVAGLTSVERNMTGLRFRETIQIWGSDTGPDDYLYTFPTSSFWTQTDGTVERSRTVTIADDILDEDGIFYPTDEIYAKVWIRPLLPSTGYRRSNIVKHKF